MALENQPFEVIGINPPYVDLLDNGNRLRLSDIYNENLLPIPLTAEILEKNGWLSPRAGIDRDTWWWTNKVDTAIEASEFQGEWQLTIIEQREIQYNYRLGLGLKYVHQLQHALRLAGVEKEIVL